VDVLILQNYKIMEALFYGVDCQISTSIIEPKEKFVKEQEQKFAKPKTNKGVEAFEKLRLLYLKNSSPTVTKHSVHLCSKELTWLCLNDTMIRFQNLKKLGSFTGLRVLEMNSCDKLIKLPSSISNLSLLTEL
jgi:hypothetical protein